MSFSRKFTAVLTAGIMLAAGNAAILPKDILSNISLCASAETIVASGDFGKNLTWKLDSEGTLTISGEGEMKESDGVPWIDYHYFISSVIIEDGIINIKDCLFGYCTDLVSVSIPDSVISIGDYAFSNCESLTTITIPDSVTSIGEYAFYFCTSLTTITIPDSVKSIGGNAFTCTPWLEAKQKENPLVIVNNIVIDGTQCYGDIIIPDGVESITDDAFSSLDSITIPESVTSIGGRAFDNCTSLNSINVASGNADYTSVDGVLFNKDITTLLEYPDDKIFSKYIIPESVTSIGTGAFNHSPFTSLTIPDNVTSIGDCAFANSEYLISITIPDSVTSIGENAFDTCTSLNSITIPDSITRIEDHTFSSCESLKSITLPYSITSIGSQAFWGCNSLTSVTIPDSVTLIKHGAFEYCTALTSITIENPKTNISDAIETIFYKAVIYGYDDSLAQDYAKKYNRKFESLGKAAITEEGDAEDASGIILIIQILTAIVIALCGGTLIFIIYRKKNGKNVK